MKGSLAFEEKSIPSKEMALEHSMETLCVKELLGSEEGDLPHLPSEHDWRKYLEKSNRVNEIDG